MMPPGNLLRMVTRNTVRSPKHFVLSAFGIVIGIAAFVFFLGLSLGVRNVIIGKIFPIERVEVISPRTSFLGKDTTVPLDDKTVEMLKQHPDVADALPRMRAVFPAAGFGSFEGEEIAFEVGGFADGIDPSYVADDPKLAQLFQDWEKDGPGPACKPDPNSKKNPCAQPDLYYCDESDNRCHRRVPVIISPTVLEIYNGQVASSHGLPVIGDFEQFFLERNMERLRFTIALGETMVAGSRASIKQACPACPTCPTVCEEKPADGAGAKPDPKAGAETKKDDKKEPGTGAGTAAKPDAVADKDKAAKPDQTGKDDKDDAPKASSRRVEGVLIGISPKAMPIGMTIPIDYIRRWNREYAGEAAADTYSSIIVTLRDKDRLAPFSAWLEENNLRLEDSMGERFATVIFFVTLALVLISLTIVTISAINIAHNFFMQVSERRREIGVLRAVGATKADVQLIILGEAAVIGIVGGLLGVGLAVAGAWLVDLGHANLARYPFKPATLFDFQPLIIAAGIGAATIFCVLGGYLPARKASRMAPAQALAQN